MPTIQTLPLDTLWAELTVRERSAVCEDLAEHEGTDLHGRLEKLVRRHHQRGTDLGVARTHIRGEPHPQSHLEIFHQPTIASQHHNENRIFIDPPQLEREVAGKESQCPQPRSVATQSSTEHTCLESARACSLATKQRASNSHEAASQDFSCNARDEPEKNDDLPDNIASKVRQHSPVGHLDVLTSGCRQKCVQNPGHGPSKHEDAHSGSPSTGRLLEDAPNDLGTFQAPVLRDQTTDKARADSQVLETKRKAVDEENTTSSEKRQRTLKYSDKRKTPQADVRSGEKKLRSTRDLVMNTDTSSPSPTEMRTTRTDAAPKPYPEGVLLSNRDPTTNVLMDKATRSISSSETQSPSTLAVLNGRGAFRGGSSRTITPPPDKSQVNMRPLSVAVKETQGKRMMKTIRTRPASAMKTDIRPSTKTKDSQDSSAGSQIVARNDHQPDIAGKSSRPEKSHTAYLAGIFAARPDSNQQGPEKIEDIARRKADDIKDGRSHSNAGRAGVQRRQLCIHCDSWFLPSKNLSKTCRRHTGKLMRPNSWRTNSDSCSRVYPAFEHNGRELQGSCSAQSSASMEMLFKSTS